MHAEKLGWKHMKKVKNLALGKAESTKCRLLYIRSGCTKRS